MKGRPNPMPFQVKFLAVVFLLALAIPVRAQEERVANAQFWTVTAISAAATIADVELSFSCIRRRTCREVNPLIPDSRPKAYAMQAGFTAGYAAIGYFMKKNGIGIWWLPQLSLVGVHGVGAGLALRF